MQQRREVRRDMHRILLRQLQRIDLHARVPGNIREVVQRQRQLRLTGFIVTSLVGRFRSALIDLHISPLCRCLPPRVPRHCLAEALQMRFAWICCAVTLGCGSTQFNGLFEGGVDEGSVDGSASGNEGGNPNRFDGSVPPVQITCGPQLQCTAAQACCVGQMNGSPSYSCVNGTCPIDQPMLMCAKTADCPMNDVCCVHVQNNTIASACMATCPSTNAWAQLCDPQAMPTGCPMGVMCSNNNIGDWNLPQNFATCGGKGN